MSIYHQPDPDWLMGDLDEDDDFTDDFDFDYEDDDDLVE